MAGTGRTVQARAGLRTAVAPETHFRDAPRGLSGRWMSILECMSATKPLLSRPEQVLYARLVRAFPGHVVLAHVALSRLLVANFMVFRPDFTAVAAVEFHHPAHRSGDAQRCGVPDRQRRKARLLNDAGIKVVFVDAHDMPDERALKSLVVALPLNSSAAELLRRVS